MRLVSTVLLAMLGCRAGESGAINRLTIHNTCVRSSAGGVSVFASVPIHYTVGSDMAAATVYSLLCDVSTKRCWGSELDVFPERPLKQGDAIEIDNGSLKSLIGGLATIELLPGESLTLDLDRGLITVVNSVEPDKRVVAAGGGAIRGRGEAQCATTL